MYRILPDVVSSGIQSVARCGGYILYKAVGRPINSLQHGVEYSTSLTLTLFPEWTSLFLGETSIQSSKSDH